MQQRQTLRVRIVDQTSMPRAREEDPILLPHHVPRLEQRIQLAAELAPAVLPDAAVLRVEEFLRGGQPVRGVGAGFGDEVDLEAGGAEDVEGVEGFGYEEACRGLVSWMVAELGFGRSRGLLLWSYRSPCLRDIGGRVRL